MHLKDKWQTKHRQSLRNRSTELVDLNIGLEKREVVGKKVANLRRNGITPIHMYGAEINSIALQCDSAQIDRIVLQAGTNIPVNVTVDGDDGDHLCFVREIQYHPVTEKILHVDFIKVNTEQRIRAEVPVIVDGISPAVRTMGGTLLQPLQSVTVEALPMDIPATLQLDAELLTDFETNLYVHDLETSENITIINEETEMVATVVAPRVESDPIQAATEDDESESTEGETVESEPEE